MAIIKRLQNWLFRPVPPEVPAPKPVHCLECDAEAIGSATELTILGATYTFGRSNRCPQHTIEYMEKFATRCQKCNKPILVGHLVADSGLDNGTFVHNTMECALPGAFVGKWGEGKLIHFNEMFENYQ